MHLTLNELGVAVSDSGFPRVPGTGPAIANPDGPGSSIGCHRYVNQKWKRVAPSHCQSIIH